MSNDEWRTPQWLFSRLTDWFRLDYDAAATGANALCVAYSDRRGTWGRNPVTGYYPERLSDDDGLTQSWAGRRVFLNPPYSRGSMMRWMAKAWSEREAAQIIVALVKHDPTTKWWQRYIGLNGEHAIVLPVPVRLKHSDAAAGAPWPSAIIIWRRSLKASPS